MIGRTTYAIPRGSTGALNPQSLTAGTVNLTDSAQGAEVMPSQTAESFFGRLHQSMGDRLQVTVGAMVTHRRASLQSGGTQETLAVPSAYPFYVNPGAVKTPVLVDYDFADDLGPMTPRADVLVIASALRFERQIGTSSMLSVVASHASERERQHTTGDVNDAEVNAALDNTDRAQALNVFGDGSFTNRGTLAGLQRIPWYHSLSVYDTYTVKLDGELWPMPAGPVKEAVGAEVRSQRFDTTASDGILAATQTRFRRLMAAGFGELDIPVFSRSSALPAVYGLDLSAAVRFEHYTHAVHSTTPALAIRWLPVPQIRVTGKYSESVRVPNAGDVDTTRNATLITALNDHGGTSPAVLAGGGNPDLVEERAKSYALGLAFAPIWPDEVTGSDTQNGAVQGVSRIGLTVFKDHFYNRIQAPTVPSGRLLNVLNDPGLQYLVVRNPSTALLQEICSSGQLVGADRAGCERAPVLVDLRLRNLQSLTAHGIDVDAGVAWQPARGSLLWTVRGTWFLAYDAINAPDTSKVSLLNTTGNPVDLILQSTLRWKRGGWFSAVTLNRANHYRNTNVIPNVPVGMSVTVDLELGHKWGGEAGSPGPGELEMGVTAVNVLNSAPPAALDPVQQRAWDPSNAPVYRRLVGFYLRKSW